MMGRSERNFGHRSWKAASKISGGKSVVKMSCLVSSIPDEKGRIANATPAATRPMLYGTRKRLATIATTAAIRRRISTRSMVIPVIRDYHNLEQLLA
jgi:hypothetical protein